jgi:glycosyltransferase involved in cell wall biosynthesis
MGIPLVSVVIPCFNQARYLRGSLRSVRAQTWPRIESIVVDDGSADDTSLVAAMDAATRVVRQTNRGLSGARNAGLAAARGEYVVFLDADDELLFDAVRTGVESLQQHPEAGAVARRCLMMDGEGRPLRATYPPIQSGDLYEELLRGFNFVWTPGAVIFRRTAIDAIGGFPTLHPAAADYAVLLALARRGQLLFEPIEVVRYRKHDSNMSGDPRLMLRAVLAILDEERRHAPSKYLPALTAGRRRWREFYGEHLTVEIRREWRTRRRWRSIATATLFLCRHCPSTAVTHFGRKLSRIMRQVPPTPLEELTNPISHSDSTDAV